MSLPDRIGGVFSSQFLPFRYRMPIELQIPVEAADINRRRIASIVVLERLIVDHIDDRTDDRGRIFGDTRKQRL